MRTRSRFSFAAIALFLLLPLSTYPQVPDSSSTASSSEAAAGKKRLKIGVALEGGGALGLAHIGVLQWFEDHHIPIDYIAGTSMGGLVGGLYATGKSPAELKALVENRTGTPSSTDKPATRIYPSATKRTSAPFPTASSSVCEKASPCPRA